MDVQVRIERKTRYAPVLVAILIVLSIVDDYQGWRFLLLALGGVWWMSHLWARSLATNLRLHREMRFGWAQVGDQFEERFTLVNSGRIPGLWVELIDHSNIPGYNVNQATGIDAGSSYQWRTSNACTRRGLFTLGPISLRTSDPLGLYTIEIHHPQTVNLMVTPPIVPLPKIDVAPGGRAGQGRPRPNAPERTVSAAGVREYVPGDSLRWIHWRTTARREEMFVRLFDSTPSGDWWIILDVDLNAQAGQGARSTEEHSVILAASLADRGLHSGKAVGMVAHGEPFVWLPPSEGENQRWEILRSLALLKPASHPLAELLIALRPSLGQYTSLVIITANTRGDWLEGLLPLIWLGAVPTILMLDPHAFYDQENPGSLPATDQVDHQMARWGISRHLITPDLLDRPEAQPGKKGQWEWRVSPRGRAVALNPARDTSWKAIT